MTDWPLVEPDEIFADERGEIVSLLNIPMGGASLITSEIGSVRANHYHKTDWHTCYVLSGMIQYAFRPVGGEVIKHMLVKEGMMVYTPPMVEHTMFFPKTTKFIVLSRNPRKQALYEDDTVSCECLISGI